MWNDEAPAEAARGESARRKLLQAAVGLVAIPIVSAALAAPTPMPPPQPGPSGPTFGASPPVGYPDFGAAPAARPNAGYAPPLQSFEEPFVDLRRADKLLQAEKQAEEKARQIDRLRQQGEERNRKLLEIEQSHQQGGLPIQRPSRDSNLGTPSERPKPPTPPVPLRQAPPNQF